MLLEAALFVMTNVRVRIDGFKRKHQLKSENSALNLNKDDTDHPET